MMTKNTWDLVMATGSVKIVQVTTSEHGGVVKDPAYRQNDFLFFGNLSSRTIFCIGWLSAVKQ